MWKVHAADCMLAQEFLRDESDVRVFGISLSDIYVNYGLDVRKRDGQYDLGQPTFEPFGKKAVAAYRTLLSR